MNIGIRGIIGTVKLVRQVSARKRSFIAVSLAIFATSVGGLAKLDLLPEPAPTQTVAASVDEPVATTTPIVSEYPMQIEIASIGLSTTIVNPTAVDIGTLDKALLKGAVRYPTSAKLGEEGNVVLFGHSSYLPAVVNPAYKAFNDIQKLKGGDMIHVSSANAVYTYRVRSVTKESTITGVIPLAVSGKILTLSTCDSFGAKTDRFVVTADFVESHPIAS